MKESILVLLIMLTVSSIVLAHPGRTDSRGGHYNRRTGEYHYHNGGNSTNRSNSSSSNPTLPPVRTPTRTPNTTPIYTPTPIVAVNPDATIQHTPSPTPQPSYWQLEEKDGGIIGLIWAIISTSFYSVFISLFASMFILTALRGFISKIKSEKISTILIVACIIIITILFFPAIWNDTL